MAPGIKIKRQPDPNSQFNSFSDKFGLAYGAKQILTPVYVRESSRADLPTPLMFPLTNLCYPKFP
jgi:hypothetical protein